MKKIAISHNLIIPGYGVIPKGKEFMVSRFNKRYVYVQINSGSTLRLARKSDCIIIY